MRLLRVPVLLLCVLLCAASAFAAETEYDDCDARFIAFIGSSAYQFSPAHRGELGSVRLFAILSYQRAAHQRRFGPALWQLQIDRVEDGTRVLTLDGQVYIGREGAAVAETWWDGRDERGEIVPDGAYSYTFVARYQSIGPAHRFEPGVPFAASYGEAIGEEALSSTDHVIVNSALMPADANELRISANATSCQVQQNTPIEASFAYNFYYGSTHAHSNWSDGGQPTTACASGNAYGSGTFPPASVYSYARNTAGLDFWVINEHNHLIQDAIATNNPPVTEAKVRQRYQDGLAAANTATVSGSFVALYGMEWGVSSNSDQGHLTLIETPKLFGWETCSTCNGPNPECTPGTNCYFDVFTPKRFGYLALYAASVANPSSAGALGIFNHPGSGEFDNFAFNANADNAMQGIAVRSGLAFATATDCANTNVGSSDYSPRWREALNKGFHLGPVADHDSHCNNYGMALPTRTVYLASSLTKPNIMAAHRARHFFASEDPNAQLVFRTSDGARIMGDIFNAAGGATLVANVYDPNGESVSTIEIWRGQIGGGVPASPFATYSNQSSVTLAQPLTSGTYWYYVHAIQADGHDLWSAPMWITYQPGGGTPINIGNYKIVQANAALTYNIPSGTIIPSKGYVVVGRNATKAQFQTFWGVTLGANVIYINSADTMPQLNGSETYTLRNASSVTLDGPSVAMASAGGESLKRINGCGAPGTSSSWSRVASSTANPGTGAPAACNKGVYISEFSDALGTGNYIYEFVELYNDK